MRTAMNNRLIRWLPRGLVLALVFATTASLAPAQYQWRLGAADVATLSLEARQAYELAQFEIDRIRYDRGLALLVDAARSDPDHRPLQLLVARALRARALVTGGDKARAYFEDAEALMGNVLRLPELTEREHADFAAQLEAIRLDAARIGERDTRRQSVGQAIMAQLAAEQKPASPQQGLNIWRVTTVRHAVVPTGYGRGQIYGGYTVAPVRVSQTYRGDLATVLSLASTGRVPWWGGGYGRYSRPRFASSHFAVPTQTLQSYVARRGYAQSAPLQLRVPWGTYSTTQSGGYTVLPATALRPYATGAVYSAHPWAVRRSSSIGVVRHVR